MTPDPGNAYARVAALESSLYLRNQLLRDMDWASMAHSLEVRVPLVDAHLLRTLAPLLVSRRERGKQLLADAPRPRCRRKCARAARRDSLCRSMSGCAMRDAW